jgi:PPOX class probable F420-dependent enzyme
MNNNLRQFQNQNYLNLETFYEDGRGVKTPVWFAQANEKLYVRTGAHSWKVKRIRSNPQVRVVPCKAQGQPLGAWVPAEAKLVTEQTCANEINQLLNKKYGLQKRFFDLLGKLRKDRPGVLEIELSGN